VLDKFHAQLVERQRSIEQEAFDSPPADFAGFQKRLGQHMEVTRLMNDVAEAMKGDEGDQP
jgi:hypothetical protein